MQTTLTKKERYTFDPVNHIHTLDSKPLTGITTVLSVIAKPALIPWAVKMATEYIKSNAPKEIVAEHPTTKEKVWTGNYLVTEEILNESKVAHRKKKEDAGTKGTDVHAVIENIIKVWIKKNDGDASMGESNSKQVQNFIDWAVENKVKFLESERNVYSESLWLGGIADIVCEIDGKRYVGDVKTSSAIYAEHFIQASAYAAMMVEMGLYEKFDGVVILNCKKNGQFEHAFNFDLEGNFKCFQAALTLFRHLNALKK